MDALTPLCYSHQLCRFRNGVTSAVLKRMNRVCVSELRQSCNVRAKLLANGCLQPTRLVMRP
eukprot:7055-Heterococcus_DN1.PRE.4